MALTLHHSVSDFHVILGPGRSWLPETLYFPQSRSLDPYLAHCFRKKPSYRWSHKDFAKSFNVKHVLSSVAFMGLSSLLSEYFPPVVLLCLTMAKVEWSGPDSWSPGPVLVTINPVESHSYCTLICFSLTAVTPAGEITTASTEIWGPQPHISLNRN